MENYKSIRIPLFTSTNLDKDEESTTVDEKHYRGMIESLLYLTTSRPDVLFVVWLYAQFQSISRACFFQGSHSVGRLELFWWLVGC